MLIGEQGIQLLQVTLHIVPQDDGVPPKGHAQERRMAQHLHGLFQLVHEKAKGAKARLTKAIEHGGADVIGHAVAAERCAGAARLALLVDHQDGEATVCQEAGGRHPAEAGSHHDDIVRIMQHPVTQ